MLEVDRPSRLPPSEAVTQGVRIRVVTQYVPHESSPVNQRFVFAYTVTIINESQDTLQLRTRHWTITDANQEVEEVKGEGVIGKQPVLEPNESFDYTSRCILRTPFGTMHGTYQMYHRDGTHFDAEIPAFLLAAPFVAPSGAVN